MDHLRPRQPYQTLSSTEDIFDDQQDAPIELQPQPSKLPSTSYNPLRDTAQDTSIASKPPWFSGWRVGIFYASTGVFVSLIINLAVVVWLAKSATFQDGLAELTRGNCAKIERLDTLVHLAINILSTLILSGSNYTMQVLVSPSRHEVDQAHRKGKLLDIGVSSLRNLTSISKSRVCLWGVLCLSSLPLHLLFNSAFYSALTTNDYDVFITTESFLSGANFTQSVPGLIDLESLQQRMNGFENLTNYDCIKAYAQDLVTDRRNLIIVSSSENTSNSVLDSFSYTFSTAIQVTNNHVYDPYDWICSGNTTRDYIDSHSGNVPSQDSCQPFVSYPLTHASDWAPKNFPAKYCLSEKVPEQCSFNANLPVVIIVIVCNLFKVVIMVYVVFTIRNNPLLIVGDAIASFLTIPDETTKHMCLLSCDDVYANKHQRWPAHAMTQRGHASLPPKIANPEQRRWAHAPGGGRWFLVSDIILVCIGAVVILFIVGMISLSSVAEVGVLGLGFGQVNGRTLITGGGWAPSYLSNPAKQILVSIIIVNSPQLVLSLLYFNINSLLTAMLMADEWSRFATQRKYLRVSHPVGKQRSTYFLQLPYRFAIPLIVFAILLHWFISQSLFLAVISEWNSAGDLTSSTAVATCAFSPLAIILTICLGIVLLAGLIVLGRKKYNPYIPLAGCRSAAIAAACHVPYWEEDVATKPLQWGVTRNVEPPGAGLDVRALLGHCSFSSEEVTMPESGKEYGGLFRQHGSK